MSGPFRTADGTYTDVLKCDGAPGSVYLQADADFIGDIDNVSVKEVHPGYELIENGTFDTDLTGWTAITGGALALVDNTIEVTSTLTDFGIAVQGFATEIGKTYSATASVVSVSPRA